jgi:hypothetical protein
MGDGCAWNSSRRSESASYIQRHLSKFTHSPEALCLFLQARCSPPLQHQDALV